MVDFREKFRKSVPEHIERIKYLPVSQEHTPLKLKVTHSQKNRKTNTRNNVST